MSNEDNNIRNLVGKILFSTSSASDELSKSMIYLCSHDKNGAMGIIINKIIPNMTVCNVLKKMKIDASGVENLDILFGGAEEKDRCFILHSNDYMSPNSTIIHDRIALTVNGDILSMLTSTTGPEKKILCMGCCLWEVDQLENEVASSYWIPIDPDEALIFGNPKVDKWSQAWLKIGSNTNVFLNSLGNA